MKYFPTTHWSVIAEASMTTGETARLALEKLCSTYWYPLYAYSRHLGDSPQDAEDFVQCFFVELLEKNLLTKAKVEKGRFRSFLLRSFNFCRSKQREKLSALKRCGGAQTLSFDALEGEERYAATAINPMTAEVHFEREWAIAVLGEAHRRLAAKYAAADKQQVFTELKIFLQFAERGPTYAQMASKLGKSEAALKMEVSRIRAQYREQVKDVVAETVSDLSDVDEELGYLLAVLCTTLP